MVGVFIVSDSHITRSGLRWILGSQKTIHVVGEVSVKRATAETIARHRPDIVLVDIDPRGAEVLAVIANLHEAVWKSAVLILSDLLDCELSQKALTVGASGIVLKIQPPALLIAAIFELCPAYRDNSLREAGIKNDLANHTGLTNLSNDPNITKIDSLTARELEIIRLVGLGLKNKDISNRLSISDITVRHHLTSIFCKLDISDRQNLLILAHRYGLVDLTLKAESA
jgi:DNA-binding NarL/FixJ family response regulator